MLRRVWLQVCDDMSILYHSSSEAASLATGQAVSKLAVLELKALATQDSAPRRNWYLKPPLGREPKEREREREGGGLSLPFVVCTVTVLFLFL